MQDKFIQNKYTASLHYILTKHKKNSFNYTH